MKKGLQDKKVTLTEVKGRMGGALQHVGWGSDGVGKVVSFVIDNWPIREAGNMSANGGKGAEAMVYRDQLEKVIESTKDESDKCHGARESGPTRGIVGTARDRVMVMQLMG